MLRDPEFSDLILTETCVYFEIWERHKVEVLIQVAAPPWSHL